MKLNIIKRLIGVAIFCFLPGFVLANMSVYPMELGIGETGVAQIRIISQSDGVQFVKVTEKKYSILVLNKNRKRTLSNLDKARW